MTYSFVKFTKAQQRALSGLPADGSWTTKLSKGLSPAVHSLILYHRDLAEAEVGSFGARGGWMYRYRLTEAGIKVRAELTP